MEFTSSSVIYATLRGPNGASAYQPGATLRVAACTKPRVLKERSIFRNRERVPIKADAAFLQNALILRCLIPG